MKFAFAITGLIAAVNAGTHTAFADRFVACNKVSATDLRTKKNLNSCNKIAVTNEKPCCAKFWRKDLPWDTPAASIPAPVYKCMTRNDRNIWGAEYIDYSVQAVGPPIVKPAVYAWSC